MQKRRTSKKLDCLKKMPPQHHTLQGETFSYKKSEIVQWALKQEILLDWMCQCFMNSGYLKFDTEKRTWQGADYDD